MKMVDHLKDIFDCIIDGDQNTISDKVQAAIDCGLDPESILDNGMVAAMKEVGRLYEEGEFFVPEMLISARAMKTGMDRLKPYLVKADFKPAGKIVAGTVKGDLHDIGKNLLCMMLEGAAFEIVDLGADVPPEKFVQAVQETGAEFVAMSALLTTTMSNMKDTIEALKAAGLRDRVKVMVGGAPVNPQFAKSIGADGYAADANKAVALFKSFVAA
jgi:5-methyltetrahydrofolate--homocysteine methyltransferase